MILSPRTRRILLIVCLLVLFFLFSPILIVFPLAFSDSSFLVWPPTGFSLRWFETFFQQTKWVSATINSFKVAILTTLISLLVGTMASFGIARMRGIRRSLLYIFFIIPMVIPAIVLALAYYFGFAEIGIKRSMLTVLIAHIIIATPYVVTNVTAGLANFDWNTHRASQSLGAGPVATFRNIVLPSIGPSLVSGGLFAFITSFDEVVIAQFISGTAFKTLPMEMFAGIKNEIQPTISAAAAMLIVLSVVIQGGAQYISNRREDVITGRRRKKATQTPRP